MPATHSKPLIHGISWQLLFLRTLIVGASSCLATVASSNEETGATEPAVRSHLFRARRALAKTLEEWK